MKNLALLTSLFALAACGGGSGGGGAAIDSVVIPSAGGTDAVRAANLNVASNIDNGEKRSKVIENNYSAAGLDVPELNTLSPQGGMDQNRASVSRKGHANYGWDFVDGIYANMNRWLGESGKKPQSDADYEQYKHALIMAGHVNDAHGNPLFKDKDISEIKEIIDSILSSDVLSDIRQRASAIYEELGTFKEFHIEDSAMYYILEEGGQNKIIFRVNDKNIIDAVTMHQSSESGADLIYDLKRTNFDASEYSTQGLTVYDYSLGNIDVANGHDYEPMGDEHAIEISVTTELSMDELKEKFKAEIDREYNNSKFHSYHELTTEEIEAARQQLIDGGNENPDWSAVETLAQEIAAQKMRDAAKARVDNWENDEFAVKEVKVFDIDMVVENYGKDVGLAYSDFGKLTTNVYPRGGEPETDETIIYGGYADKRVETIEKNVKFTGSAVGIARYTVEQNWGDEVYETGTKDLNGVATLDVRVGDGGQLSETLNASFANNDWYDVTVINNSDGNSITFTDNTTNGIDANYKFLGDVSDEPYVVNNFTTGNNIDGNADGITGSRQGGYEIQYYGNKSNNPTEVVGFVSYVEGEPFTAPESEHENDLIRNVGVEFGFGMQKDFTQ